MRAVSVFARSTRRSGTEQSAIERTLFLFGFHCFTYFIGNFMYIGLGTVVLIIVLFLIFKR